MPEGREEWMGERGFPDWEARTQIAALRVEVANLTASVTTIITDAKDAAREAASAARQTATEAREGRRNIFTGIVVGGALALISAVLQVAVATGHTLAH